MRRPADPVALFASECKRSAAVLWREYLRHTKAHNCDRPGDATAIRCDLRMVLCSAWVEANQWAEAVAWLLEGKPPSLNRFEWREFLDPPIEGNA